MSEESNHAGWAWFSKDKKELRIGFKNESNRIDEDRTFIMSVDNLDELRNGVTKRRSVDVYKSGSFQQTEQKREDLRIDDIQTVFPQELAGMLYFEQSGEQILIRPRQYLGKENFARIAAIVRDELRGTYVSAGRDSHFKVATLNLSR